MGIILNMIKRICIEVLIGVLIIILVCANNIYHPIKEVYQTSYQHEDIYFNSLDGTKLNAWYIEPKQGYPTILFSHGNGGNISYFFDMLTKAADKGYGIFIYDYRGYGKSKGFPYENGLYQDIEAAIKYLNTEKKTSDENIILWGLSLGGAVSTKAALSHNFKALILQSTFTNIKDMGEATLYRITKNENTKYIIKIIPFFQKYDTYSRIDKIKIPILIIHSKDDSLIPYKLAIKNASKNQSAKLKLVNDDNHNDYENSLPIIINFIENLK